MPLTNDAENFTTYLRRELSGFFTFKTTLAVCVCVAGALSIFPTLDVLWAMWMYDPVKSLGMFIPLVSLGLTLAAWRRTGWTLDGSWWGLGVVALTVAAVHLRSQAVLLLVLSPSISIFLPPHGLVLFAYVSGVVLLMGGTRLYRAALFPLLLLLCVDPVPHLFNVYIDLPLQRMAAHVARGFAMAMGQKLTPDQLRLMFTPDFGMFIAPGCNGIRGAATMGYIALVAGYVYRFRLRLWAAVVAAAVLLGYAFNFVRLCVLVLYYLVALRIPWLQDRATGGDYVIGACLFTLAASALILTIRKYGRPKEAYPAPLETTGRGYWPKLATLAVVVSVGSIAYAGPAAVMIARRMSGAEQRQAAVVRGEFPKELGGYRLERTWAEQLSTGTIVYEWAEYVSAESGVRIQLGVSPVLGAHDTTLCHVARGEEAVWQGTLKLRSADGAEESFSASQYNDSVSQYMEAGTQCTPTGCGEYTVLHKNFGIIFSRPNAGTLIAQPGEMKPLPVLLRAETTDMGLTAGAARERLVGELRAFTGGMSLARLVAEYRGPSAEAGRP